MMVLVCGIVMTVRMRVAGAVSVHVLVLVKDDADAPSKGIRDATQRPQARNVVAPLQARDHRLCHPQAGGQLLLCLARVGAQLQELPRAVRGERGALIQLAATTSTYTGDSARSHDADV
jgi:hypothetical protein